MRHVFRPPGHMRTFRYPSPSSFAVATAASSDRSRAVDHDRGFGIRRQFLHMFGKGCFKDAGLA